jgi:hypothetical protein
MAYLALETLAGERAQLRAHLAKKRAALNVKRRENAEKQRVLRVKRMERVAL